MEYFMITVKIGEETFYDTAKRLEAARRRDRAESRSELKDKVFRQIESGKSVFEDIKL